MCSVHKVTLTKAFTTNLRTVARSKTLLLSIQLLTVNVIAAIIVAIGSVESSCLKNTHNVHEADIATQLSYT